ncbi:MAG: hypothetical protein CMJ72_01970 [Planctomycetaceae bacterium]|nr:hypothetical protein [Planctomycetaceae bacterium]
MSTATSTSPGDSDLQCMEVWGGNGSRENHFVRPGVDVWITSQAVDCNLSGGSDLYLLSSCSSGRITRMMVAEVCGQLPHYTKLSYELRELMKQNINTIRQARFVSEISRRFAECSEHGCFATTMISTFFSPTRTLSFCNTGNPPPLLFNSQQQDWSTLKQVPKDLTITPESWCVTDFEEYQNFETKLNVDDLALCFSNAITECCDTQGRTIGMEGVFERVRKLDPTQPEQLIATLTEQIKQEHPDNLAFDDTTILLCQGTMTTVPWKDNLLAPLRYFQGATDKAKIE